MAAGIPVDVFSSTSTECVTDDGKDSRRAYVTFLVGNGNYRSTARSLHPKDASSARWSPSRESNPVRHGVLRR
ncbi:hypothetical protein MLD38_008550 [Melastoma candidum]|uniref:Uncharacterized protein n=1 Tax=Melastoma candidum TaxID=119954 RepID=A0ACB9RVY9_9MYRT|nr:hypothetical protein MLD38_008550 [Melastoma candidum]